MPPRKKARTSRAASPTPTFQPKTPTPAASSPDNAEEQLVNDPWTDEEEIGLFKGLMRWKPTGIHKHFYMMALHQFLLDGGHIHPKAAHTKPAGIWRRLESLYNLEALDEREDARQLDEVQTRERASDEETGDAADDDADVYSNAANKIDNEDFELPDGEFGQDKWDRRLESTKQRKGSSPMLMAELNLASEPPVRFTPSFSIEPSETATPASRRVRPGTGLASSRGKPAVKAATSSRRSARQTESAADEAEDEDEVGEVEEEEGSEEEEESERSTPAPRSTRNKQPTRGRTGARGQVRGRGRGK